MDIDIFEEVKVPRVYELLVKLLGYQRIEDEKFYKYGYVNTRIPYHINAIRRVINSDSEEPEGEEDVEYEEEEEEEDPRLCYPASYQDQSLYMIETGSVIPGPGPLRRSGKIYMTGAYHSIAIPEKIDFKDMIELYEEEANEIKLIEHEKYLRNFLENIYTLNEVNEGMDIQDFMDREYLCMEGGFNFLMDRSIELTVDEYKRGYLEEFDYLSQITLRKIMFSFSEEVRKVKYQSYITDEDVRAASIIENNPLKVIWLKKVHNHLKRLRRNIYKNYELLECVLCRSKVQLPNQIYRHGISLKHFKKSLYFLDIFMGNRGKTRARLIYNCILYFLGIHLINVNFNFYCFNDGPIF